MQQICVKNLPNTRDQTQSPQFSSDAELLISSGSNDSSCPRLCPCDQTTVQKHGLPTRLCNSETQSEEKASRTKTQRKLGLDDSVSVDADPPPEGRTSLEDGDYSDPCIKFPTLYLDVLVDIFFMVRCCLVAAVGCVCVGGGGFKPPT